MKVWSTGGSLGILTGKEVQRRIHLDSYHFSTLARVGFTVRFSP